MKIVIISDTHLRHRYYPVDVPEADILIHCGDALNGGEAKELPFFAEWFAGLKAKHKVFVAGNHDWVFEKQPALARGLLPKEVIYLQDEQAEVAGLKIYGSPWQPEFSNWAFNLPRGLSLRKKWEAIPEGIDILVTHGPPMGILDWSNFGGEHVGCADMRQELARVKPKLHCFGHIHGSYGTAEWAGTLFVNAATCDEQYMANQPAVVVELEPGGTPTIVPGPGLGTPVRKVVPIRHRSKPLW